MALGGGVIGDMCGFAAAAYQRGVHFIQIPTTLMAMVDSSVGGKTGVNHPLGKNMIGAFYQPRCVLVDTNTLGSLPPRELASGLAEVVKYGLIRDAPLFGWLEANVGGVLARDRDALVHVIQRSCVNKAEVVAADEREGGVRATLNLGHTFGHAIETGTGYGTFLHGEAVAIGTCMAADMSHRLGWIDRPLLDRTARAPPRRGAAYASVRPRPRARGLIRRGWPAQVALMRACQLPVQLPAVGSLGGQMTRTKFSDLMAVDKKAANGKLRLILLKARPGCAPPRSLGELSHSRASAPLSRGPCLGARGRWAAACSRETLRRRR